MIQYTKSNPFFCLEMVKLVFEQKFFVPNSNWFCKQKCLIISGQNLRFSAFVIVCMAQFPPGRHGSHSQLTGRRCSQHQRAETLPKDKAHH